MENFPVKSVYTDSLFDELYRKINLTAEADKKKLKNAILNAEQTYRKFIETHEKQLPSHEVKKELEKAISYLDKAKDALSKVRISGQHNSEIANNLYQSISQSYPSLHGTLAELRKVEDFFTIVQHQIFFDSLDSINDAIKLTVKDFPTQKFRTNKSDAAYHWLTSFSEILEPLIGHKLGQGHYNKGEYVSKKKKVSDSDLLLFIFKPLDGNATASTMENTIKETHEERHNSPWDDYYD